MPIFGGACPESALFVLGFALRFCPLDSVSHGANVRLKIDNHAISDEATASSQGQTKATADKQAQIANTEVVKTALIRQPQQPVMNGGRLPDRRSGNELRRHICRHDARVRHGHHGIRKHTQRDGLWHFRGGNVRVFEQPGGGR